LVLHPVASVETHTVVPPLNTDPITVGPIATPIDPTDGPTNDNGGGVNAGRAGRAGNVGKAARGADGVAALASATGAAITAAAEIAAAATARRLIHVTRLFLSIDFSLGRPRQHRPDHEDEHSAVERLSPSAQTAALGRFDLRNSVAPNRRLAHAQPSSLTPARRPASLALLPKPSEPEAARGSRS
jgi:hypothetical protein